MFNAISVWFLFTLFSASWAAIVRENEILAGDLFPAGDPNWARHKHRGGNCMFPGSGFIETGMKDASLTLNITPEYIRLQAFFISAKEGPMFNIVFDGKIDPGQRTTYNFHDAILHCNTVVYEARFPQGNHTIEIINAGRDSGNMWPTSVLRLTRIVLTYNGTEKAPDPSGHPCKCSHTTQTPAKVFLAGGVIGGIGGVSSLVVILAMLFPRHRPTPSLLNSGSQSTSERLYNISEDRPLATTDSTAPAPQLELSGEAEIQRTEINSSETSINIADGECATEGDLSKLISRGVASL